MTKPLLLATCLLLALAPTARAQGCVDDVQSVDRALASLPAAPPDAGADEDDLAEAEALRDKGAALCQDGQRAEAEAVLLLAKALLGIT
jgi:hypothetical protein